MNDSGKFMAGRNTFCVLFSKTANADPSINDVVVKFSQQVDGPALLGRGTIEVRALLRLPSALSSNSGPLMHGLILVGLVGFEPTTKGL
jgi:hypothetical protein